MEIISVIFLYLLAPALFLLLLFFAFYLFVKKTNKKVEKIKELKTENNVEYLDKPSRKKPTPLPRVYSLNVHSVKYNKYDCFKSWNTSSVYNDIVLSQLWLQEPFHTAFARLLLLLERNELWIKVPASKELILTSRDQDEKLCCGVSLKVVFLNEFLYESLSFLLEKYQVYNQETRQFLVLVFFARIITISKKIETVKINKKMDEFEFIRWLCEPMHKQEVKKFEKFFNYDMSEELVNEMLEKVLKENGGQKYLYELKGDPNEIQKEPLILPNLPKKSFLPL